MKKPTPEMIANYHDGELSLSQANEVEQYLLANPDEKHTLKSLERVGDLIRLMHEETEQDVSFDGFSERISQGILATEQSKPSKNIGIWLSEFFEHRKTVWMPVSALAAAAAIALTFAFALNGAPQIESVGQTDAPVWIASAASNTHYSKISSVDFGDSEGKVFEVETAGGGAAGVVWIVE